VPSSDVYGVARVVAPDLTEPSLKPAWANKPAGGKSLGCSPTSLEPYVLCAAGMPIRSVLIHDGDGEDPPSSRGSLERGGSLPTRAWRPDERLERQPSDTRAREAAWALNEVITPFRGGGTDFACTEYKWRAACGATGGSFGWTRSSLGR
jgi:hypothetical protein